MLQFHSETSLVKPSLCALFLSLGIFVSSVAVAIDDASRWTRESQDAIARAKSFKERQRQVSQTAPAIEKDRLRILQSRKTEAIAIEAARKAFVQKRSQEVDESVMNDRVEQLDEEKQKLSDQRMEAARKIYTNGRERYLSILSGPGYIDPFVEEGLEDLPEKFKNEKRDSPNTGSKSF